MTMPELTENMIAELTCPITQEILIDPVLTTAGKTYERAAITEWLRTNNKDPLAGIILTNKTLTADTKAMMLLDLYKEELRVHRRYTNEEIAMKVITYAIEGCPVDNDLGEESMAGFRVEGYLNISKMDIVRLQVKESLTLNHISIPEKGLQEIFIRRLAKELKTILDLDTIQLKSSRSFSKTELFKGRHPYPKRHNEFKHAISCQKKGADLAGFIKDSFDKVLAELDPVQSTQMTRR